jgi:hypothetical protein
MGRRIPLKVRKALFKATVNLKPPKIWYRHSGWTGGGGKGVKIAGWVDRRSSEIRLDTLPSPRGQDAEPFGRE